MSKKQNLATSIKSTNEELRLKKHIAVLMGGWTSEREVSITSGNAVFEALTELGYKATKIDFDRNIAAKLQKIKPDIVFNALHGQYGEDGSIQGLLDIINIPYTHSGVTASALCMDKVLTRKICATVGVLSPEYFLIKKGEDKNNKIILEKFGKPFVIKPINDGSSVGVEIILKNMDFDIVNYHWGYGDEVIIERYIAGQEIQVAIMDNKSLGAIEVCPHGLFYDYKSKYTPGMTDYIMPANISPRKYNEILDLALRCHKVAGCEGISRIDFILNNKDGGDDKFYLLEINTQPGFTPLSLVPKIAKYQGISFKEIVEYLIKSARCGVERIY